MASAQFIQTAYIAFFNRPADVPGMNFWLTTTQSDEDLLALFATSAEYLSDYTGLTNMQMVTRVYNNLFNRDPEAAGLNYWVAQMEAGHVTIANVAWAILNGAQNEDLETILNKSAAAQSFTDSLVTAAQQQAYNNAGDNGVGNAAKAWLATVNDSASSLAAAQAGITNLVQTLVDADTAGPDPSGDSDIWLGGSNPTIYGHATENNTFIAQTGQLHDNVILDGRGGYNTLDVSIRGDEAIAPTTYNIQHVKIRVQDGSGQSGEDGKPGGGHTDNNVWDYATIDADRFHGVNVWENRNSRADLKIEDVRIKNDQITKDIKIIFRESDPGHVDYAVYFDQSSLRNQTTSSGILHVALFDSVGAAAGNPLQDNPYTRILFRVDGGDPFDINFGAVQGTSTFEDLRAAIQLAIDSNPLLAAYNISVNLVENVVFMVPDEVAIARADATYYLELVSVGHTLTEYGWATGTGIVPPGISTQGRQTSSNPTVSDLVTSTIVLDYVGRGSMGGDLVIGGLSVGYTSASKGVQQFDISVQRDSRLEVIASTNNTLQVVNLVNDGTYDYYGAYERDSNKGARYGDLKVFGNTTVNTIFGDKATGGFGNPTGGSPIANQVIDGLPPAHHNNGYGFTDVRVINAGGFLGNLALNAVLTGDCVEKYMNLRDRAPAYASTDNINFTYTLGSGNDHFELAIDSANLEKFGTVTREDFVLTINGGGGDDVLSAGIVTSDLASWADGLGGTAHWYINHKANANLTINAGSGNNVINTFGSGDWTIKLSTNGSDTYYADNTGDKAVWVFNTANQNGAALNAAREIDNIQTGSNSNYIYVDDGYAVSGTPGFQAASLEMSGLHGLKLRVLFHDKSDTENLLAAGAPAVGTGQGVFFSNVVAVPALNNGFTITDLNINQAIKQAINTDTVLSKLLVAEDGPGNSLVVTSLVDGSAVNFEDLQIEFAIPDAIYNTNVAQWRTAIGADSSWTDAHLVQARNGSFNMLINNAYAVDFAGLTASTYNNCGPNPGSGYSAWYSPNDNATTSYASALAQDAGIMLWGSSLDHISCNTIIVNGSTGDKNVIVLSTGADSSDVVKFEGFNNGLTTIVNFEANGAGFGRDLLDFTSYGAKWLGAATLDINGWVNPATGWDVACDVRGSGGAGANVDLADSLPTITAMPATEYEDWYALNVGDKYITLTRTDQSTDTYGADPHWGTTYKIELWTVANRPVGGLANAYEQAATSPRDTVQLIGYIDLGRDIDGYGAVDSILGAIDFIPG